MLVEIMGILGWAAILMMLLAYLWSSYDDRAKASRVLFIAGAVTAVSTIVVRFGEVLT